jgi:hypothetical protein
MKIIKMPSGCKHRHAYYSVTPNGTNAKLQLGFKENNQSAMCVCVTTVCRTSCIMALKKESDVMAQNSQEKIRNNCVHTKNALGRTTLTWSKKPQETR